MKICPKCNEKFGSGKFCKFCGTALVEEEQELHCSNCGAKVEDSDSCWKLGRCYLYGIGTEEDDEQAFRWIQKAVDLDEKNYSALKLLGDCYQNGWGTSENIGKAIECYKKAANGNNADA